MRFSLRYGPAALAALLLAGCASSSKDPLAYTHGEFSQTDTFLRSYSMPAESVCEGGRRALLSQGYALTDNNGNMRQVEGHKQFQNSPENHREITFRLVCEADHGQTAHTIAFVSAVESTYSLKKTNNSASLGVGLFGSLSMPFGSSDDSMVKVGSETIAAPSFYDRFFHLLERYVPAVPPTSAQPAPVAAPAPAAPVATPPAARQPQARQPGGKQPEDQPPEVKQPAPASEPVAPAPAPQPPADVPVQPENGPDSHQLDSPHDAEPPPADKAPVPSEQPPGEPSSSAPAAAPEQAALLIPIPAAPPLGAGPDGVLASSGVKP